MMLADVALHGVDVDNSIFTSESSIGGGPACEAIVDVELLHGRAERCWEEREGIDGQALAEFHPIWESVVALFDIVIGEDVAGGIGLTEGDTAAATLEQVNTTVPPESHVLKHIVRHQVSPPRLQDDPCR